MLAKHQYNRPGVEDLLSKAYFEEEESEESVLSSHPDDLKDMIVDTSKLDLTEFNSHLNQLR